MDFLNLFFLVFPSPIFWCKAPRCPRKEGDGIPATQISLKRVHECLENWNIWHQISCQAKTVSVRVCEPIFEVFHHGDYLLEKHRPADSGLRSVICVLRRTLLLSPPQTHTKSSTQAVYVCLWEMGKEKERLFLTHAHFQFTCQDAGKQALVYWHETA